MNNQVTPTGAIVRHSSTALRFATGDLAKAEYVDAKLLDEALARISELEKAQCEPFSWSYKLGGEQRFYPTDPRLSNFGAYAELMSDVEPLFRQAGSEQHQGDPAKLRFPTMLRKMWSGGEVQQWLEEQGPLYRHQDTAQQ